MFANFFSNSAYSVCAPILPLELGRKGISDSFIGLVFALYSFGSITWSPVVGKYLIKKVGADNLVGLGLGVMGITFVCLGCINLIENPTGILVLTSILRVIQGMCYTTYFTSCLSILTKAPAELKEKVLGMNTAMSGCGLLAGPLIGSALFTLLDFKWTFFVYGSVEVLIAILIRINLHLLDDGTPEQDNDTPEQDIETPEQDNESPPLNTEYPLLETEAPEEDIEFPGQDIENPKPPIEALEQDNGTLEQDNKIPEQETKIPKQDSETR